MNGPMAFCPRCQKDVIFTQSGRMRKCAVCGLEFEQTVPYTPKADAVSAIVMTIGHVILRVVLIFGVIVLVGIAVLFASCAFHL